MDNLQTARLSHAIQRIIIESGQERLRPKELMPQLIAQGFFSKDEKFGKPLRDVLNRLDKEGRLHLLPQVIAERQEKAVYWYFEAVEDHLLPPAPNGPEESPSKAKTKKPATKAATAKAGAKTTGKHAVTKASKKESVAKAVKSPVKKSSAKKVGK